MFGMSLGKLLMLLAVVAAVWVAFRWIQRTNRISEGQARRERLGSLAGEETAKCPQCGVYVIARTAGDCGRIGCPFAKTAAR